MEWMILPLKRYADFRGRSRRKEFWLFMLFYSVVTIALFTFFIAGLAWTDIGRDATTQLSNIGGPFLLGGAIFLIWYLATLIPMLAVTVRRLHDRGLSGWWYGGLLIAGFVPLVNLLILPGYLALLIFLCLDGEKGANKWGPDPKDPGEASVFR